MDVAVWLRNLGFERYEPAFRDNEITADVLPELTDADLQELGLPLGPRRALLKAIATLRTLSPTSSDARADATAGPSRNLRDLTGAPEPQAERRQLTVMFCDLIGSTALSARLDPEDLREVIGAYHRCVDDVVGQGDGFVAQYLGDGALVYFGYPQAHEHDAERAIRAGLALVDALGRLDTAAGPLQTRIGIATGLVVVGDLMRSGSAQERGVVGRTPNLAARLQAIAEPDTVVIDTGTRRLTGGLFDYADLGTVTAKGFAEPLQAWRVLGESAVASRFEALRTGARSLVGRDEELALLSRCWEQARNGEGRVVLLSGEPGIGKSRLMAALEEKLEAEPLSRQRCFCSPYHANSALFPVIGHLERAAAFEHNDSSEVKLGKLERLLEPTSPPAEDVGLLAGLLSLPAGGYALDPDITPEHRKDRILQALLRQQRQVSQHRPMLVLFEDVHWIDPTSRQLLDLMVEQAARLPVLILMTCRPEFQPSWIEQAHITLAPLHRLHRHDGAALVEVVAGNHALPDDIVAEILDRADGIPLFVEELTKAVLETAGSESGAAGVLSAIPAKAHAVPVTLHASLISRLDRLVADAKAVAQTGAAIGREFSYMLLATAAGVESRARWREGSPS